MSTIKPGKDVSGYISNGSLIREMTPMVMNISMATITVTGRFNENCGKFILFNASGGQGALLQNCPLHPRKTSHLHGNSSLRGSFYLFPLLPFSLPTDSLPTGHLRRGLFNNNTVDDGDED